MSVNFNHQNFLQDPNKSLTLPAARRKRTHKKCPFSISEAAKSRYPGCRKQARFPVSNFIKISQDFARHIPAVPAATDDRTPRVKFYVISRGGVRRPARLA